MTNFSFNLIPLSAIERVLLNTLETTNCMCTYVQLLVPFPQEAMYGLINDPSLVSFIWMKDTTC